MDGTKHWYESSTLLGLSIITIAFLGNLLGVSLEDVSRDVGTITWALVETIGIIVTFNGRITANKIIT
jgi:hypothetical protein